MENAYGIGITNRYALFLDEEADPLDILKQSEKDQLAAKNKKIEAATKPASKVAPVKSANNRNESGKFVFNNFHSFNVDPVTSLCVVFLAYAFVLPLKILIRFATLTSKLLHLNPTSVVS